MFIDLKQAATFGVAGNFTGHLEQAGEARDFTLSFYAGMILIFLSVFSQSLIKSKSLEKSSKV